MCARRPYRGLGNSDSGGNSSPRSPQAVSAWVPLNTRLLGAKARPVLEGLPPPPRLWFGLWKLLPVGGGSDPAVPSQDMIHIADTKVARRYGDFFIRQIHKFEEVRRSR